MRKRDWLVAAVVALMMISVTAHPRLTALDAFSIDALYWLRDQLFGQRHSGESSPTVIVAIDEETYRRAPFEGVPKVMWTPQIGRVIEGLLDAGVKVIGQDLILPTSVDRYIRRHDKPYLSALQRAKDEGRIVLSRVQHLTGGEQGLAQMIWPYEKHRLAVDRSANIRLVNFDIDADGIIRRVPLFFDLGDQTVEPSFSLELALRALGAKAERTADGTVRLAGAEIPGSASNTMLLNFDGGKRPIPAYSLADLWDCAEAGRTEFFTRNFKDKVVVLGAVLDVEDRKITSQRFIAQPDVTWQGERCVHALVPGLYQVSPVRNSIPGVLLHATAVNNLIRQEALRPLPAGVDWAVGFVFVALAAVLSMAIRPLWAGVALIAGALGWALLCTILFQADIVLPLVEPPVAAAVALTVLLGYRFTVADRQKRFIRKAFGYYLPPTLVRQLARSERQPNLGGELRELSVWFSDLADFTAISEDLTPTEIVSFMNRYLTEMTDIVEAHGGFVEKYIGDAIVAVFGAPIEATDHAERAVRSAIACQLRLAEIAPHLGLHPDRKVAQRIGINTGEMLIGNIGSTRRFNYTVMGDCVNLASRLEGANKAYGTSILVNEDTWRICRGTIQFREIDLVQVTGRIAPARIFEPAGASVAPPESFEAFAGALGLYRARNFAQAKTAFERLAPHDPVAARFAARSETFTIVPPKQDWDGVHRLTKK